MVRKKRVAFRVKGKLVSFLAKIKPKKRGKTIKVSKKQVGKSNYRRDKKRKALKPGKRRSKSGKVYYERRRNRSDKDRRRKI